MKKTIITIFVLATLLGCESCRIGQSRADRLRIKYYKANFKYYYTEHRKFVQMGICNKLAYMEKLVYYDTLPLSGYRIEDEMLYSMASYIGQIYGDSVTIQCGGIGCGYMDVATLDADILRLRRKYKCKECCPPTDPYWIRKKDTVNLGPK